MRKQTRLLSLLLAVLLAASMLTVPASAAGSKPTIKQVEAGDYISLAVTSNGDLYGWGLNSRLSSDGGGNMGKLFGSGDPVKAPVKIMSGVKSVSASSTELQPVMRVSKSDAYGSIYYGQEPGIVLMIIKENGDLYTWGDNTCYQLGKGYYEAKQDSYDPYFVMSHVVDAATNDHACAAVTESGDLYFWGHNMLYGYGNNVTELYASPTKILSGVKDVELSEYNVVALKEDGSVWMMGGTYKGAMAREDSTTGGSLVNQMTKIMDGCKDIAAGTGFAMALKSDGTLYGWGNNGFGAMGIHWNTAYVTSPIVVATGVRSVDAGNRNAYFIKTDNSLWVTGDGQRGQRGQGTDTLYYDTVSKKEKTYHYYPERVDTDVRSVSAGATHMLYLKNDGTMWGCGLEYQYEFGRGTVYGCVEPGSGQHLSACWWPVQCGLSYGAYTNMFGTTFRDVTDDAYFYDAVNWAVDEGITSGTTATTFSPYQTCTRAQIITFLWRAAGSPEAGNLYGTWDVTADKYYFKAVQWAAEQGMIEQFGNFEPDAPCTRLMAVDFMWKAAGSPLYPTTEFSDVSADQAAAVNWAVDQGVTNGTSATTFSPDVACTRGQIVTFLYRAAH